MMMEPETEVDPELDDERGFIVLRLGTLSVEDNDALTASISVQPFRGKDVPWRGAYGQLKFAANVFSDFHGLDRSGFEAGYLFAGINRQWFRLTAATGLSLDHWDIYHDDNELRQGKGMGVAGVVRPILRLSVFEISVPIEFGYSSAVKSNYSAAGVSLGLALF